MTKDMQTAIRVLSEKVTEKLQSSNIASLYEEWPVIAQLEQARQLAMLTEELHRMGRRMDELVACTKGILLRMEGEQ